MKLKHAVVFATALSLTPFAAIAAKKAAPKAAAPKPVIPTLDAVLGASGINLSGMVDMSYDWNGNDTAGGRQFDVDDSSFVFHQLNFTVSKSWNNGISMVLNPIIGEDASFLAGTGARGTTSIALAQAYLSYNLGGVTLSGGRMLTLAGSEVINTGGNLNASRGLLFTNLQPLLHTGLRASYALCKEITLTGGLVNGGAAGITHVNNNNDLSFEGQVAFNSGILSVAYTNYTGVEDATAGAGDATNVLHDIVVSVTPTDALTLGLNVDFNHFENNIVGLPTQTDNFGMAAYSNLKLTPKARVALRGEYVSLDVNDGTGTLRTNYSYYNSLTGTFGYSPISGLELIAEYRTDNLADGPGSVNTLGIGQNALPANTSFQNSGTIKAVYKF